MLRSIEAGANPMEAKKRLAANVTDRFHGAGAGDAAREQFERTSNAGRRKRKTTPPFRSRAWPTRS